MYEVDRQTLADAGFVANASSISSFRTARERPESAGINSQQATRIASAQNPGSLQRDQEASAEKHKIIVFCDDLGPDWIARIAAVTPLVGEISMRTPADARVNILPLHGGGTQVIFMSRTGDVGLDLPTHPRRRFGTIGAPGDRRSAIFDPIFLVALERNSRHRSGAKTLVAHGSTSHLQAESLYGVKNLKDGAVYAAVAQSVDRPSK